MVALRMQANALGFGYDSYFGAELAGKAKDVRSNRS
jgi:hypothetical protein